MKTQAQHRQPGDQDLVSWSDQHDTYQQLSFPHLRIAFLSNTTASSCSSPSEGSTG